MCFPAFSSAFRKPPSLRDSRVAKTGSRAGCQLDGTELSVSDCAIAATHCEIGALSLST